MKAGAVRRFKDRLRAGEVPTSPAVLGRKFRLLQLAEMTIATRPTGKAKPDRLRLGFDSGALDWVICGKAVSYGQPIHLTDGSVVTVRSGAFSDWLDSRLPFVCLEHEDGMGRDDPESSIACAELSTLLLIDRPDGLYFRARPADSTLGMDAVRMIWDGALTGASVNWTGPTYGRDAQGRRTLLKARLREISLTAAPCDRSTFIKTVHAPGVPLAAVDFDQRARAASRGRSGMSVAEARRQLGLRVLTPTGG
jgi:HK97 family phage prohead protease